MITLRSLPTSQVFVKAICELVLEPVHEVKSTLAVDRRTSNRFDSGYDKEHGFASHQLGFCMTFSLILR